MKTQYLCKNLLAAAGAALLFNHTTLAMQIEEVVVTAQKRAENVQDVPIAISAFQGDALKERGVTDISNLSNVAPSVTLDAGTPFSGSTAVLGAFIRGIGSNDFAMNIDPGVGVYLDGVYLARSVGANLDLPDVERIEVLKGPQGTLFGRNTIGGAVSVVTRTPGDMFEFEAGLTIGEDGRQDFRGYVAVPIADGLSGSLAFASKNRDGIGERIAFPGADGYVFEDITVFRSAGYDAASEEGDQDEWTLRAKLFWDASDSVNVTLSSDYMEQDQQGQNSTLLATLGGLSGLYNTCVSLTTEQLAGAGLTNICGDRGTQVNPDMILPSFASANVDADPNNDRLLYNDQFLTGSKDKTYSTGANFSKLRSFSASAIIDWDINDNLTLKSITSYRDLDWAAAQDMDGSPLVIADNSFSTVQDQLSQEFQLTGSALDESLNFVVGAYYFQEDGVLVDHPSFGQGLLQIYGPNDIETENTAVFGQVDWRINDLVGITIGGRYTVEDKNIDIGQEELNGLVYKLPLNAANAQTPVEELAAIADTVPFLVASEPLLYGFVDEQSEEFKNFSAKLGVQLYPTEDIMVYASWSEGYKTGGWTTRFTVPTESVEPFDEEEATTVELGIKSQLLDNSVQLNAAVFATDYENIQLNQQVGVSPTIDNQGDAEIKGVEIELLAMLSESFSVNANVSYLDATFSEILPEAFLAPSDLQAGVYKGSELPKTPEWQFNLSPRYEWSLNSGASVVLLADYTWTDELWNDTERTYLLKRDSVENLNMSLIFAPASEQWQVTLGATNLLDERYLQTGFAQPATGILSGTYSRGSQWYASFRYSL
jgi:outer membrane receptor protein involved in Fe transport